jgi:nitroimidazol reductase NimA-like FMN-containing flavoprotein (pyridoxamine 5'-phosphate oxidase superfamily)
MTLKQGDPELLNHPIAKVALESINLARLAYVWPDNTPRVVPIWFHWTGEEVVLGTPPNAPKMAALRQNPNVALTIDDATWPYKGLLIRGRATIEVVDGVAPEYAAAAWRYLGKEKGQAWIEAVSRLSPQHGRISILPEWVGLIDFQAFQALLSGSSDA